MAVLFAVVMIVAFIVINVVVRMVMDRMREAKARKERLEALDIGLRLDFAEEAKSLRRVEVPNPFDSFPTRDGAAEFQDLNPIAAIALAAGYALRGMQDDG